MKFDMAHKLLFGLLAGILLAGILLGRSWLAEHDASLKLSSTLDAQKSVIDSAAEREKTRNEALAQTLSELAKAKARVVTSQQAAIAIPNELNSALPAPITINMPPQEPGKPAPQAEVRVPPEDLKPLNDLIIDCQECKAKLATAQANISDENLAIGALEKERDAAVKASKGTFWGHVKRAAKWLTIGAVSGGIAVCATGHCK